MTYDQYIIEQKKSGIVKGDIVTLFKKPRSYSGGWDYEWFKDLNHHVGKVFEVKQVIDNTIILLDRQDGDIYVPFFCLKKAKPRRGFPIIIEFKNRTGKKLKTFKI